MGLHNAVSEVLRAAAGAEPARYDPPPCHGCEAMVQECDPVYLCECGAILHRSCGEAHAAGRSGHGDMGMAEKHVDRLAGLRGPATGHGT